MLVLIAPVTAEESRAEMSQFKGESKTVVFVCFVQYILFYFKQVELFFSFKIAMVNRIPRVWNSGGRRLGKPEEGKYKTAYAFQEGQYGTVYAFQEGQYGTVYVFQKGRYGNLLEIECKSE